MLNFAVASKADRLSVKRADIKKNSHSVLQVETKSGKIFVIDLTHWQYVWPEVVQPKEIYAIEKINCTDEEVPFIGDANSFEKMTERDLEINRRGMGDIQRLQYDCREEASRQLVQRLSEIDQSDRSLTDPTHSDEEVMERLKIIVAQETRRAVDEFQTRFHEEIKEA